jgi:putative ABC transport system permease protein
MAMPYSLATLWFDRQRYLPGVLAVGFSALLITLQCGLLLGLFSITSMPIDRNNAEVWMGAPGVQSVDLGRPIREGCLARVAAQPEIEQCEIYLQGFAYWARKKDGATELCMVVGARLAEDSLGAVEPLRADPEKMAMLTEPGTIIIDESDKSRLGVEKVGDVAEISGVRVRVVAFTKGVKSLAGPYVFCSITTSRPLLRLLPDQITYVLGKCKNPADAPKVVKRLSGEYKNVSTFSADSFSFQSRKHWVLKTKAGVALGYDAALGLMVGAVVTSQTLYAATAASIREFAVLRALGIPRWRMSLMVMNQAFWVGILGIMVAMPAAYGFAALADYMGVQILMKWWLLTSAATTTLLMAIGSGLLALRSLRDVEPATLLR